MHPDNAVSGANLFHFIPSVATLVSHWRASYKINMLDYILTSWEQIEDEEYREKAWQMAGAFNPEILKCLFVRMTQGPLDWEKVLSRN